jgi:RNA polymerase sigma factor (sigma-70 family)
MAMTGAQMGSILCHLRKLAGAPGPGPADDGLLLERFTAQRDEAAFAELVRRHGGLVLGVGRTVLEDWHDAEDVFQATFLVLARKAATVHRPESLASWLFGVAYHLAVKVRADSARRRARERKAAPMPAADPVLDVTLREVRRVLYEELRQLPDKYRTPLVLCYLEGKTQEEAGRLLGWTKGAVRGRLDRGREKLRGRLARRGLALGAGLIATALTSHPAAASVPSALVHVTVQGALAAGTASTPIAALVEGVTKAMILTNGKIATLALLALGLLAAGTGVRLHQALAAGPGPQAAPKPPAARGPTGPKPAPAPEADGVAVQGRVLGPDGKPFSGATIRLWTNADGTKADLPIRATTDKEGRFRFAAPAADLEREPLILARAPGHGPDWVELKKSEGTGLTLRLARDDVPIQGRLLDLEGQPVGGAAVQVLLLEQPVGGDLDRWLTMPRMPGSALQKQIRLALDKEGTPPKQLLRTELLAGPATVQTGKDGRFRLTGFGRDRLVVLSIRAPGLENTLVSVVTRADLPGGTNGIYPARFKHLAGPSKPIVGVVRDKATGKPLAGIRVSSPLGQAKTLTDAKGHYRLDGIGKQKQYVVSARGSAYFAAIKAEIADTPDLDPIPVDFDLERGLLVRGKLTDRATGRPVRGQVTYVARADNPRLKDLPGFERQLPGAADTAADGSFEVLALPGPGFLCVAAPGNYVPAEVKDWDGALLKTVPGGVHPGFYNAIVPIEPGDQEATPVSRSVALEPGRTRTGTVDGPDGKPLSGVLVYGLEPVPDVGRLAGFVALKIGAPPTKLPTAAFTATGLDPRRPRALVFFHPEKNLAKVQRVRGDEAEAVKVRLEPLGAISGRIVGEDGKPRAGLRVGVFLSTDFADFQGLPIGLFGGRSRLRYLVNATTDAEGKFRVAGLVPGLKYDLLAGKRMAVKKGLSAESGQTRDVGQITTDLGSEKE